MILLHSSDMHGTVVRRRFGRVVLFSCLVILLGVITYQLLTFVFTITTIEVLGNNVDVQIDQKRISKNLLFFPAESLRDEIVRDNSLLKDVQFIKRFPHTLQIVPILREPCCILQTSDRLVLIDRTGVVLFDGAQGLVLPSIYIPLPSIRVGEKISHVALQLSLQYIEGLRQILPIYSITYQDSKVLLAKCEKVDIYIPQNRSSSEILATLQTLITRFRIKGTLPAVVDLRFDKPIVKY